MTQVDEVFIDFWSDVITDPSRRAGLRLLFVG